MVRQLQTRSDRLLSAQAQLGSPGNGKKNKSTGKEPEDVDQEDKSETAKFQDASKTINVIFGGDEDFCSKREQKLLLREILSIEPAVPRPL
jgi:hypothetical protein